MYPSISHLHLPWIFARQKWIRLGGSQTSMGHTLDAWECLPIRSHHHMTSYDLPVNSHRPLENHPMKSHLHHILQPYNFSKSFQVIFQGASPSNIQAISNGRVLTPPRHDPGTGVWGTPLQPSSTGLRRSATDAAVDHPPRPERRRCARWNGYHGSRARPAEGYIVIYIYIYTPFQKVNMSHEKIWQLEDSELFLSLVCWVFYIPPDVF